MAAAATGAAGIAAASFLGGCAPQAKSDSNGSSSASTSAAGEYDETFDVIVVGAGFAGMTSALTVATEGEGVTCLLAEKESKANGCSPVAAGGTLCRDDKNEYPIQYLKDMMATPTGPVTPDDVVEAFCDGINENLDWILSLGATKDMLLLKGVYEDRNISEYREFDSWAAPYFAFNPENEAPYNHLLNFMNDVREKQYADAIDFRTNAPLEALIQDEEGRVTGAVIGGKRIKANRGVIMACGGYEHNQDMLRDYVGNGSIISFGGTGNTGDGIGIAAKAGADMWHMHPVSGVWMAPRDLDNTKFSNGSLTSHLFKKYGITVGANGRRYYMDWDAHKALDFANDERGIEFSQHVGSRHGLTQFGGEWGAVLPHPSQAWFVFDQAALDAGAFDFKTSGSTDPVADGWLLTSDSIEGLAEQMNVPVDELVTTVATWNTFCENGEDLAFFRPSDTLTPVATPPYYAQICAPAMLNTVGGPKRTAKAEILSTNGEPIPGLYGAGEFGSVWGNLYNGNGMVGEALAFGRIAARNCLAAE